MVESAQLDSTQQTLTIKESRPAATPEGSGRLLSLDALRGLVMLLMLNEATQLPLVAGSFPNSTLWIVMAYNTDHVQWQRCSLHDLIQPAFSFLVGAALPFSIAIERSEFSQNVGACSCFPARVPSSKVSGQLT